MIKVLEAFDHEQGARSRVILPDRRPPAPLRARRPAPPARATHLTPRDLGPARRSEAGQGPPLPAGSLHALCLLAVLGGATTLAGIARFAVDAAPETGSRIDLTRLPRATTLGRLLSRIDGNAFDDAVSAWLARYSRTRHPRWWDWPSTARPYAPAAVTTGRPSTSWPRSCTRARP
ncbi:transposase family protein [Streptomyces sp. NPDC005799]|uniref:transposase family protein n=1 Tax=Streptomyces sp. NPDC005799 TaxID=3154678 RepID=UPI0033DB8165